MSEAVTRVRAVCGCGHDLLLPLVGWQARGWVWPNAAEAVSDDGCLEASKDAAIAGSRVLLDVAVEDVHQRSGGVAGKLDGDSVGVHPRQTIPHTPAGTELLEAGVE